MKKTCGGVVVNEHGEVLLVHRRRQKDWGLPKGRRMRGETILDCAEREIEEETGYIPQCVYSPASYFTQTSPNGKRQRLYWLMKPVSISSQFKKSNEIDRMAWLPFEYVNRILSPEDASVVDHFRRDIRSLVKTL